MRKTGAVLPPEQAWRQGLTAGEIEAIMKEARETKKKPVEIARKRKPKR